MFSVNDWAHGPIAALPIEASLRRGGATRRSGKRSARRRERGQSAAPKRGGARARGFLAFAGPNWAWNFFRGYLETFHFYLVLAVCFLSRHRVLSRDSLTYAQSNLRSRDPRRTLQELCIRRYTPSECTNRLIYVSLHTLRYQRIKFTNNLLFPAVC